MVEHIISLGIGSPAAIPQFILFGLNPFPDPPEPVSAIGLKATVTDVRNRATVTAIRTRATVEG